MRRMFSEKQLASIVADVLSKNEVLSHITYEDDVLVFDAYLTAQEGISVPDFDSIEDENGITLQNWVIDNVLSNPTDLSGINETFASEPTGHQLPNADKNNLTPEEIATIKNNMLYWIKKGYVYTGASILKIVYYRLDGNNININAGFTMFNSNGTLDSLELIYLSLVDENYSYQFEEI